MVVKKFASAKNITVLLQLLNKTISNSKSNVFRSCFVLILLLWTAHAGAQTGSPLPSMRISVGQLPTDSALPSLASQKKDPTPALSSSSRERSKVFCISDKKVINAEFTINRILLRSMLQELVCGVTGKKNTTKAWQSLIKTGAQGDVVGIKVATEPGLLSGTHRELIKALIEELKTAGVLPEKIIVWDRRQQDLQSAGYSLEPGFPIQWIEHGSGYDPKQTFTSSLVGQLMYGDFDFREAPHSFEEWREHTQNQLSNESHYAWLLTQRIDKVINVPSLCDSSYCGINGSLANMTLSVIDNWRRFIKTPHCGDPYIPTLYATELIKNKIILTILDGLALQYAGGPGADPSHTISYGALFASYDPVALDATALQLLNNERHTQKFPSMGPLASHIETAEALGLGHAAEKDIEVVWRKKF